MENCVEIFGNIMRKKVAIMRKRRQIMRKFLKLIRYKLHVNFLPRILFNIFDFLLPFCVQVFLHST